MPAADLQTRQLAVLSPRGKLGPRPNKRKNIRVPEGVSGAGDGLHPLPPPHTQLHKIFGA